jgi:hypothetical protein
MNVNDLVDALGLPRYFAAQLPAGSSIVATVRPDGSVAIEVQQVIGGEYHGVPVREPVSVLPVTEQRRGPGRPRKVI